jgi:hypothetical protein
LLVRAQIKRFAGNVALNIGKKIFVRGDAESGWPALPFDYERSPGVDLREGGNRAFIGFDVAIASNSYPPASSGQSDARGQKYNSDLLHVTMVL